MNIYFSASLSKHRHLLPLLQDVGHMVEEMGHTITSQHVLDEETTKKLDWENDYNPELLIKRELKRLEEADGLVTEATVPSFGAAFLIDRAIELKKPLLTLHYGLWEEVPLMLRGRAKEINLHVYSEETIRELLTHFLS